MKTIFASLLALTTLTSVAATANAGDLLRDLERHGQIVTTHGILGQH